ncbi:hypothetical protein ACUVJI_18155 [Vibrio parahaemolyticus]|uniref:hypothetical protein n=1 Tax=Vibrio parahaemolyticus TaxID=670 RepID=UPI001D16DC49|nr:hypothetical protein [Vibrio parahaemolyticus]MCC3856067.1 hypothetical protein [Vibrio parahaemolyticus]MCI9684070.1 hypothetical protein [Vibrio parahaemolyticus]
MYLKTVLFSASTLLILGCNSESTNPSTEESGWIVVSSHYEPRKHQVIYEKHSRKGLSLATNVPDLDLPLTYQLANQIIEVKEELTFGENIDGNRLTWKAIGNSKRRENQVHYGVNKDYSASNEGIAIGYVNFESRFEAEGKLGIEKLFIAMYDDVKSVKFYSGWDSSKISCYQNTFDEDLACYGEILINDDIVHVFDKYLPYEYLNMVYDTVMSKGREEIIEADFQHQIKYLLVAKENNVEMH